MFYAAAGVVVVVVVVVLLTVLNAPNTVIVDRVLGTSFIRMQLMEDGNLAIGGWNLCFGRSRDRWCREMQMLRGVNPGRWRYKYWGCGVWWIGGWWGRSEIFWEQGRVFFVVDVS